MSAPELLLRGASWLMALLGVAVAVWLLDTTVFDPLSRIRRDLPFWIPFLATILVGAAALSWLFRRAAERLFPNEEDPADENE